ncbi:hypothetical protein BIW11_10187 [Tropilaelaps mercedesae]|uniref:Uncharacterized protein n=1 Tax=Tropilaelaps mercedesae TaxID=418985 RepID=A0A1V9XGU1_9ACAR|nr:hypothetical protein BIW11_10187 [Tropilaelaps mercedesae]
MKMAIIIEVSVTTTSKCLNLSLLVVLVTWQRQLTYLVLPSKCTVRASPWRASVRVSNRRNAFVLQNIFHVVISMLTCHFISEVKVL